MAKFLIGLVIVVGVCVWSFNYTEGHESTLRKQKNKECMAELDRISFSLDILANEYNSLQSQYRWKLEKACDLLNAAKIETDICEEPEEKAEEKVEEENSDE